MKIEARRLLAPFGDLDVGSLFRDEKGEIYIKTETAPSYGACVNCVNLRTGAVDEKERNDAVTPIDGKLVVWDPLHETEV